MPSYQFTFINGSRHDVGLSIVLDNLAAARAHAEQLARTAAERRVYPGGARIQVTLAGVPVLEVPIEDEPGA
jgi:hypothetical protein